MNAMASVFLLTLFFLMITISVAMDGQLSMGCYLLGAEINGDYSTEYLYLGNCY